MNHQFIFSGLNDVCVCVNFGASEKPSVATVEYGLYSASGWVWFIPYIFNGDAGARSAISKSLSSASELRESVLVVKVEVRMIRFIVEGSKLWQ